MPVAPAPNLVALSESLELKGSPSGLSWGTRAGFPLGISLGDASAQSDVFIHVRYPHHGFAEGAEPELIFAEPLPRLMDEGLAEVEIRDDLAWMPLKRLGDRLERDEIVPAVDSLLGCLNTLGIHAVETCHYCDRADGVAVMASKGRVGQICTSCVEEQIGKDVSQLGFRARSLGPLSILAPIVITVQAVLWGGIWIGVDGALARMGGSISLNYYVAFLIVLGMAGLAASPAFLFRFVSNRGKRRAAVLGGLCALCAIVLGEVLHISYLVGTLWAIVPLLTQPGVLLEWLVPDDGFFSVLRFFTMVTFVWIAGRWAKPREVSLEL